MTELKLSVLDEELLAFVLPWFDDESTQAALGGREWAQQALRLMGTQPGAPDGDRVVEDRVVWVACEDNSPVGLADVEIYSDGTAALAYVVSPDHRRRGLCPLLIGAVLKHPRHAAVKKWIAGVDSSNASSARCLARVGFQQVSTEPDAEAMIQYELDVEGSGV